MACVLADHLLIADRWAAMKFASWRTMMRSAVAWTAILLVSNASYAIERFNGYLTLGCGDRYIKPTGVSETWFANLTQDQEREMFRLTGNPDFLRQAPWTTLYVELTAKLRAERKAGFFSEHAKQLDVERVISARFTSDGESVKAATSPPTSHRGHLLVGPHGFGFVSQSQSDELWWAILGRSSQYEFNKHIPAGADTKHPYSALVEVVGRVGPPGAYGAGSEYVREVAVDEFTFLRLAEPEELVGTAAIVDVDAPDTSIPRINKCTNNR